MYNISNIHFNVDKIMYNIIFNNHRYLYKKPFNSIEKSLILSHMFFSNGSFQIDCFMFSKA